MTTDYKNPLLLLAAAASITGWGLAHAQTPAPTPASPTRAEVKMEAAEFRKTHVYDAANETWMVKPGVEPPAGIKSRAEVRSERDKFLKANKWSESESRWVPVKGEPRNLSTLPRETVKMETAMFLKTHRWDEASEQWVENASAKKK